MQIRDLLKRHGIRLERGLGQHFLIDENVLHSVAQASEANTDTDLVEIGAGLGNLSYMLALSGANVTAIELDRRFEPVHREMLLVDPKLGDRLQFKYMDALDFDFAAAAESSRTRGRKFAIAGNIPYQITSPLVMQIFESGALFDVMVLMMQREVAERLASSPGSKRNGAISIKVQFFAEIETMFDVPAEAFLPPPEVQSQVLKFRRRPEAYGAWQPLFRLVDAAFAQRRKMLPNSVAARGIGYTREQVDNALSTLGLPASTRAEQLGLQDFIRLEAALRQEG